MSTRDENFPSAWLKASDCEPPIVVVVERCTRERVGQGSTAETKPVLHFHGATKPWILNRTNWDAMVALTGHDDSDDWAGARIELYTVDVVGPNGQTRGIRIRRPKAIKKTAAQIIPTTVSPPEDIDVAMPTLDGDDEFGF